MLRPSLFFLHRFRDLSTHSLSSCRCLSYCGPRYLNVCVVLPPLTPPDPLGRQLFFENRQRHRDAGTNNSRSGRNNASNKSNDGSTCFGGFLLCCRRRRRSCCGRRCRNVAHVVRCGATLRRGSSHRESLAGRRGRRACFG